MASDALHGVELWQPAARRGNCCTASMMSAICDNAALLRKTGLSSDPLMSLRDILAANLGCVGDMAM
jgi:hypothetical protein